MWPPTLTDATWMDERLAATVERFGWDVTAASWLKLYGYPVTWADQDAGRFSR